MKGSPETCGLGLAFGATGLSEFAGPCHKREGQCGLGTAMQGGEAHTSDPGPIFSYLYFPENDPPVPASCLESGLKLTVSTLRW